MRIVEPDDLKALWSPAAPFVLTGACAIVAAGLTSAATAFAPSYHASWVVAYLVLVVGVAQIVLGLGQALLAPERPSSRVVWLEWTAFGLGNGGVLLGTLLSLPILTVLGSMALALALFLMHLQVRMPARPGWPLYVYRGMLGMLFVSIPVGLLIARL